MKKKTFLKISIAVIVALALLLAMNAQVFASITSTSNTSSITVSGLEAGVTVTAYRVIIVNYDYDADQPSTPMYEWATTSIAEWVEENYPDYYDIEAFSEITDADALAEFYSDLASAISQGTVETELSYTETTTGTQEYPVTEENATSSVTFSDVEMGQYVIITENGYRVYTPSTANVVPSYDSDEESSTYGEWLLSETYSATVKSTTPQITKTVTDDTKIADNLSTIDTIYYTVVADVPTYAEGSVSTTYKISDKLSSGLTLNTSSFEVYGDDTLLSEDVEYTITASANTYTITFTYSSISSYKQITVTYSATLNQDSTLVIGSTGNTNTATLTYSNNPYKTSSSQSQSDGATVYTYGITITKLDNDDKTTPLVGAEFTLSDSEGNVLSFIKVDGVYYLANSTDEGATSTLTTDDTGTISIKGLDVGTYILVETKAADGYNVDSTEIEITLTDDNLDGLLDDENSGIYEYTVYNKTGFSLPTTGGIGTTIFVTVGILLVGCGVALIVASKKRNNK